MGQCKTKVDDVCCCKEGGDGASLLEKFQTVATSEAYPEPAESSRRNNNFKLISSVGAMSGTADPNGPENTGRESTDCTNEDLPPSGGWTWQPPKEAEEIGAMSELADGEQVKVWPDGSTYRGQFKENKAHGRGTLEHSDGGVYKGEWMNDKAHGVGEYIGKDMSTYRGQWMWEKKQGHGVEVCADGRWYEGQYKDGAKDGKGCYTCAGGAKYDGEFAGDGFNGDGTYTWQDNRRFQGQWRNNTMHGYGTFSFPDGRKYIGEYNRNQKSGEGTFTWPDGRVYKGQWKGGKQHGIAYWTAPDAREESKHGQWEAGKWLRWIDGEEDEETAEASSTIASVDDNDNPHKVKCVN